MLTDDIQAAIKSNKAVIGFKKCLDAIKNNKPKLIVIADNLPEDMKKEIESGCRGAAIKLEVFPGSSQNLGVACGKPFPISTLAIKD